jgi:hypothetical protein
VKKSRREENRSYQIVLIRSFGESRTLFSKRVLAAGGDVE